MDKPGSSDSVLQGLIDRSADVAHRIAGFSSDFAQRRDHLRQVFLDSGLIAQADIEGVEAASSSAVDGGMFSHQKRFWDILVVSAVEAPSSGSSGETCSAWMDAVPRSSGNGDFLRAIMTSMECHLAARSDHDMVFLDGSIASILVNISTALSQAPALPGGMANPLSQELHRLVDEGFGDVLLKLLTQQYVSFPKYTTVNHFHYLDQVPPALASYDARTLASLALHPGEMTEPVYTLTSEWESVRFGPIRKVIGDRQSDEIHDLLQGIRSVYYRPHPWTSAYRFDFPPSCSEERLKVILATVHDTTSESAIMEPLPLYYADMWAKYLCEGAAPVVDVVGMADIGDVEMQAFLAMDYRTMRDVLL